MFQWNDVKIFRSTIFKFVNHMWIDVSKNWNIDDYWLIFSIDASHEIFNKRFNIKMKLKNIQIKKMFAIFHDIRLWLNRFHDIVLTIHCDNQTICVDFIFEFMRNEIMTFFRQIVMLLTFHDIIVSIVWINSKFNHLTNLFSRNRYALIVDEYSQLTHFQTKTLRH